MLITLKIYNHRSSTMKTKSIGIRMFVVLLVLATFCLVGKPAPVSAASSYWQYIPQNGYTYYWIDKGKYACWKVSQDSYAYDIYLTPFSTDVDLYVRTGYGGIWSIRSGTNTEFIHLQPMQSYSTGISACAYGYQAGYYRILVKHYGF